MAPIPEKIRTPNNTEGKNSKARLDRAQFSDFHIDMDSAFENTNKDLKEDSCPGSVSNTVDTQQHSSVRSSQDRSEDDSLC